MRGTVTDVALFDMTVGLGILMQRGGMGKSSALEAGGKVWFLAIMRHFEMKEKPIGSNQLLDKALIVINS